MSYPIRCPKCHSLDFNYTSDSSGNVRRYRCRGCDGVWLATVRGMPSGSAIGERQNLSSEDLEWVRVLK